MIFIYNSNTSSVPTVLCELTHIFPDKAEQYKAEGVNKYNTFHALSCSVQHSL